MIYNNGLMLLATRLALCTLALAMQSTAHPMCVIWKTTLCFVKKHVCYTWIISSAMLGGQKRGVRPNPLEPPLCTGLHIRLFYGWFTVYLSNFK